ncbi:MAG TPA: hypothetical protein VGM11_05610 [Acidobacteriaceae bacterium]|jgi:hypothetical protein
MKVGTGMKKAAGRLQLVHVSRNVRSTEIREATTGRPVAVPRIWAVAEPVATAILESQPARPELKVELAFYRKYTEAMLRRYMRVSTQVGRVPSVMGREMFRGNVSHYKSEGLEDGIIFCVDVERCIAKLPQSDQRVITRIALQGHTLQEAAPLLGIDFRRCHERYGHALDELTELFLASRLLEPFKSCQDVETV